MRRFLLRRLALLLPVLLGVVTSVFFLIHLIPGDPVDLMLGESASSVDRAALRASLRLDQPLLSQYGHFLVGVSGGDWGISIQSRRPVLTLIAERYPATLQLAAAAMLIAFLLAFPLGLIAAQRPRTPADYGALLFALIGVSFPSFWMGPLLIWLFSLKLGWLPVSGRGGLSHLILPALTLGTAMSALLTRMIRASLLEVIRKEYVVVAYAKGLSTAGVVLRHALPNALNPVLTVAGLQFGALLAGSVIIETIFAWPGVGRLTLQAIQMRDYPLVQGCILVIALTYLLVSVVIDLLYGLIDPRVRYER
jgi:peptide/nickel transport system permease protein